MEAVRLFVVEEEKWNAFILVQFEAMCARWLASSCCLPYHDTSFGCGDGENGRCNIGGPTLMPLVALVAAPPTMRTMPLARFWAGSACGWPPSDVKSALMRFGELTRMRNGDMVAVGPVGGEPPLLRWLVAPAVDDGMCGCGRSTVGVTGRFVIAADGGEWVLIGGELSPPMNG